MIEYIEEPHFAHHIEPAIEHVKLTAAQYYTSILSQFTNHKNDKDVHVTREDREKWDNKADKVSLYDLEQRIVDKANKKDIPTLVSELKNDVPYLTASSIDAKLDDKGYVTWEEIKNNIYKNLNLDDYVKKEYADNTYAKKSDMGDYITGSTISGYLKDYINKNSTLFYLNSNPVTFGSSITVEGSDTGVEYKAGQGISISGNTISLKKAGSTEIGGIRTDYVDNGRYYGVKINNNGSAYVMVPWTSGEGGSSDGKYYDQAFKTTTDLTVPNKPNDLFPNGSDGWHRYAENSDATKYVWMCTRLTDSTGVGLEEWNGPWLISGPEGEAGADGKGIEFVYTRTKTDEQPSSNLNAAYGTSAFQNPDFVPVGWNDNAQGVSQEWPYEWAGIRTSDSDGVWSQFVGPLIWSHYGQNGIDGDGIEYIYYANTTGSIPVGQYPNEWAAEQTDEYTGPSGSQWTDNPWDLEDLGEGSKEWVSVRKRDKDTKLWGQFSRPALWAYYSRNGVVDGYTIDLTNENMPVGTDSDGYVTNYTNTTGVQVFHNGNKDDDFTINIGTISRSDGASVTNSNVVVSANNTTKEVTVRITSLNNFASVNLFIPINITLSDGSSRTLTVTCFGIPTGDAGSSIDLKTNTHTIRTNYYKTNVVPEEIEVWAACVSGSNDMSFRKYVPGSSEAAEMGFTFGYQYNTTSSSTTELSLTSSKITNISPDYDSITINLYYKGQMIDSETIPYVQDGAPGIGTDAVNYNINVLSSTVRVSYDNEGDRDFFGKVTFTVTKQEGSNEPVEMTVSPWNTSDGETIEVEMDGSSGVATPTYNSSDGYWAIAGGSRYEGTPFTSIIVRSVTGTILASAVVPFIFEGRDGSSQVQGFDGVVMRFFNTYDSGQFYEDGSQPSSDGITYMDVVLYNGSYYRVKARGYQSSAPADANGNTSDSWILFSPSGDAAFQAFIAKFGFIENLTARELVITDDNNNPVAGMTRGTAVSGDGDAISGITRGNVRIWAGAISNGNLMGCPFYVTDGGFLHAENAEIDGDITARSLSFPDGGRIDINQGTVAIESHQRNETGGFGEVYIDCSGNSRYNNNTAWVSNSQGVGVEVEESGTGTIGSFIVGSLPNGSDSTGDFQITTSRKVGSGNIVSGTGYTGTINGARFINGICVGTN